MTRDGRSAGNTSRPFDGAYGAAYSAMIRRRRARQLFFGLWGDAAPLFRLDSIVEEAAAVAASSAVDGAEPTILDVPCGRGVIAELLARSGVAIGLVGLDLSQRAIERASTAAGASAGSVDARYVRGTALDMPFDDGSFAAIISVNGLHVMPDHRAFLAELARVLAPGGSIYLITPVSGGGVRGAAMLGAGRMLGVLSQPPPTATELEQLIDEVGLAIDEPLGGTSIVGYRLVRSA